MMKIVFLGSPYEVLAPLETIIQSQSDWGCELVGIVSQPARPAGRNRVLTDPPVAAFAKQHNIPLLQPDKARDPIFLEAFKAWKPDIAITAAYGQILTNEFLQIPRRATINIHPSLLPAYRGATPVPAALLDGKQISGVTILFTVRELDAGNIIVQQESAIRPDETSGELTLRLFELGGSMLGTALERLKDSDFVGIQQDAAQVSLCKKIQKEDGIINWSLPAPLIVNRYRAFQPWPGSSTKIGDKLVRLSGMKICAVEIAGGLTPGEFRFLKNEKKLAVGTADVPVLVERLTPAGAKEQDAAAFWNGIGQKLEHAQFG
jgi:methionyl-tRNA formyltransferase